ncbi:monovalent cation/H+ antiporter complex subunit F [Candidatus Laterigemmans baculatus]|uniref:monovalent cation/H+ antiporter complex subunit F n=1 Tax=Candidatus Laterigemmans baculatus TaxID=2770505 RepID=UPI0013DB71E9|nr:monovalent cation/H+ antiporter complex subunit F [Candidatus Laterigemmans baculatus]
MTLYGYPVVAVVSLLAMNLLVVAIFFAVVRLLRGPSLSDRVVALDLVGVLAVGMISVHAVFTGQPMLLRVAILLALVAFVGTVAFAFFLEKRGRE